MKSRKTSTFRDKNYPYIFYYDYPPKKNASKKEIAEVVKKANLPVGNGFDAANYFGKIKWEQDPVAYQRELRGTE